MSDSVNARRGFLDALLALGRYPEASRQALAAELREALLAFGSSTPDNLSCTERVSVGPVPRADGTDGTDGTGLTVTPDGLPVAEILNYAEGSEIPDDVRERFPGLRQEDWEAVQRLVTLVFTALETPGRSCE